jgi:cellulose synthase operon protein C
VRALAAAVLAAALLGTPLVAHAQGDDWEVTRDPFDKAVVGKLKGILARNPSDADALAKLLTMYRRYRTVAQLRDEYEAVLAKKPEDWPSLVVLGRIARGQGDDTTALGLFERAAKVKDDAAVSAELGALLRANGKTDEARAAFDKALTAPGSTKPVKMKALRALADLALAAKDIDGARKYFDQYIALDSGNAALRLELGDALVQAGRYDDAILVYEDTEKKLGSDPARRVEVVARIGQALEAKGDDTLAVAAYRRAIKLVPRGYYLEVELTARIVDIYRRKQTLPELLTFYEKEWPEGRRGHFEWDTLARLYEETGDQEKAVVAYKKAVAKAPYELETQRRLIQLLEAVGREKEALAQYEVVVREAPGEARFQIELAERYWRSGEEKKALEVLKRMESRFPGDAGAQSAIADMYLRWGKDDLALAALERLARLEPDDPAHLVTLGEQYHQRGQKEKAMTTWKRIANTKSASGYAKLGDVLAEHDAPAEGLVYYAKAIKLEPNNPELYKGRAQIYERQKQFEEAVTDWEKALTLWTKPSDRSARREARRRIVAVLQRWDNGRRATEYVAKWQAAFHKTPPDLEAGYFLVAHYEHPTRAVKGEPRATLERLHQLAPDDQDTIQDLVKAYVAAQMWDEAVEKLKKLAEIAPAREREVYAQIAEVLTKARRDKEAIDWSQKSLAKSPNDPVAYERLAARYFEMNQFEKSAEAYEKTIQLDPRNFKAHFALADIYDLLNHHDKAIELYRRILRQSTDDDQLLRAGKRAIVLAEAQGSLGELEKVIAPLSTILAHKPVYRRILVDLFDHYVEPLEQRTRRGPPEVRAAARAELERLGRGGMKALLDALADESDPAQRTIAISVLGHLNNKAAAMPLVRVAREEPPPVDPSAPRSVGALTQAPDLESRVAALVAAGRLGDPRVVPETLPIAKHTDVALREAAVFTLGRSGDARAQAALLAALGDGRPSVQALACLGLGRIADKAARTAVEKRVADARTPDLVRAACAVGLADDPAAGALAPLTTALADNAGETQRVAAWALGQLGDKKALPALWSAYFRRIGQDRSTIAWAIARLGAAPGTVPGLAPDATIYPMRAGKLDLAAMVRELPGELPDRDIPATAIVGHEAEIAAAIEVGLGSHRDEALSVLTDLDARDDGLGLGSIVPAAPPPAIAAALESIGAKILPTVIRRASDDDLKVASRALSVAAKIGGPTAAAAVEKALHASSPMVRATATRSIAVLHRRGAMTPALRTALVAQLASKNWEDRQNAAIALGALGADADIDALIKALRDPWSFVRDAAARSLGTLRAQSAVPALREAAKDINPAVRASAEKALSEIAGH